ncbi:MAG: phosphoribosylamine--glycine ligase [Flavobacteriales bacterium]|jgi:phosphoribosylamine--glycine ligase|tara:strand:+ start:383 stop:1678 length:1296 start_codon:yes stop_codon:yes gene_type:complete
MNVLLLGSGGREHAMAWKLSQSSLLSKLYVAPGNAGTDQIATNVALNPMDFSAVDRYIRRNSINMLIVGPEAPLVAGIVDYFLESNKHKDLVVIGPPKAGALLEGSKDFAKAFMARHNIPTSDYQTFKSGELKLAKAYLDKRKPPYVIKADGLAAGKGVIITEDRKEAESTLEDMLENSSLGEAGAKVVIEQFMDGIEVSSFVVTDGTAYKILPSAKDYKRAFDGDTGPNTGGMGAISPVPFVDAEFHEKTLNQIIIPTIKGLRKDDIPFNGFVFIGLMKVGSDPYVVEYNCRLGDPESEVILPLLKSDLLHLFDSLGSGLLSEYDLQIEDKTAATVMLTSGGYPGDYSKGKQIKGLENTPKETEGLVFHAGTTTSRGKVVTAGGRVLACTGIGNGLEQALERSYKLAESISFSDKQYRKDIGQDVLVKVV